MGAIYRSMRRPRAATDPEKFGLVVGKQRAVPLEPTGVRCYPSSAHLYQYKKIEEPHEVPFTMGGMLPIAMLI